MTWICRYLHHMNSSKAIAARGGGTVVLKEVLFPRHKYHDRNSGLTEIHYVSRYRYRYL
jgi:hypothetical protein